MANIRPKIFISYRRADTGPSVRSLANVLMQAYGADTVFFDNRSIAAGDSFPSKLMSAVRDAKIVIVAIGPSWLRAVDDHGRRRIDLEDDWVRNEILAAVEVEATILPILLQGGSLPSTAALPECLIPLLHHQAYEIRETAWEHDVSGLLDCLQSLGCRRTKIEVQYPTPHAFPKPLSPEEIETALGQVSGWSILTSPRPDNEAEVRTELVKSYEFRSFDDALKFMSSAAGYINTSNHHPRWENVFKSVVVSLTTWDIGFKPSHLDFELARYLDALHSRFKLK